MKSTIITELNSAKEEYIISARSLGLNKNEIVNNVIWKSIQPAVNETFLKNHIIIWGLVIVYEFICRTGGVGTIFNLALKYNDLSLVIVLIAILIVSIIVMELLLNNIKKKY